MKQRKDFIISEEINQISNRLLNFHPSRVREFFLNNKRLNSPISDFLNQFRHFDLNSKL